MNLFCSGWVQAVMYKKVMRSVCLLSANVMPSQRVNADPRITLTTVEKDSGMAGYVNFIEL